MAETTFIASVLRAVGTDGTYRAPASREQARLWFLAAENPRDCSYHMTYRLAIRGDLHPDLVAKSIAACVARHDAFRTVFCSDADGVWQLVEANGRVEFDALDLSTLSAVEREGAAEAAARAFARIPFSVTAGPLARFRLLSLGPRYHHLLVVIHHIIGDGWSHSVVVRDFCAFYSKAGLGELAPRLPEPLQYVDYSVWQLRNSAAVEAQIDHWLAKIDGIPAHLRLPFTGPAAQGSPAGHLIFVLDLALANAVRRYQSRRGALLSAIALAAYTGALATLAHQNAYLLGVVTANRNEDMADTVGFFANTVAIPSPTEPGLSFDRLVDKAMHELADVQAFGRAPFDEVIARGGLANAAAGDAPLTALFVVQNAPTALFAIEGLEIEVSRIREGAAKFPITLFVTETRDDLTFELEYASDRLSDDDAAYVRAHMLDILARGLANGAQPAIDLAESRVGPASVTRGEARPEWLVRSIPERLAECARATPHAVALEDTNRSITYRDLVRLVDEYAFRLADAGLPPQGVIAVCLPRSAELLVAILSAMRVGIAWCPIDPDLPDAYMRMLTASVTAVIAETAIAALPRLAPPDLASAAAAPDRCLDWPDLNAPCYLIHTSGTTGIPKGVVVQHRALVNVTAWIVDTLGLGCEDRTVWKTPIGFDAVCRELFPILVAGGTLRIAPPDTEKDMRSLSQLLHEARVTIFHCVPSQLALLSEAGPFPSSLKAIMCGGEALPARLASTVLAANALRLLNVYGPTEATVDCAFHEANGYEPDGPLPLGRPIPNTTLSIVRDGQVVPRPAIGILRVSGQGVALGYSNPTLGDAMFGENPEGRWYDTGDLAHLRDDGEVVFHGRADRQLKLRGVRIEPSAIEAALREHAWVGDAHAEYVEGAGIIAFVTPGVVRALDPASDLDAGDTEAWRAVFDAAYETIDPTVSPAFNTHGWIDSAGRRPLPDDEVLRSVESAADRILCWRPRRVLELGSGVWTLGVRLAAACESYHGIDFSESAVAYARAHAADLGLRHATLEVSPIAAFDPQGRRFDAIVLNSVVQYLGNSSTLDDLLTRLAGSLSDEGFLFVGDVRNAQFDELVSLWRTRSRMRGDESCGAVSIALDIDKLNDAEMRLHPGFFASWAVRNGFAPPLIETKTATGVSEIARFRYDVTLARDSRDEARPAPVAPIETCSNAALADEARLLRALRAAPSQMRFDAIIKDEGSLADGALPNRRITPRQRLIARPSADPLRVDLIAIGRKASLVAVCHTAGYRERESAKSGEVANWRRFVGLANTLRAALGTRLATSAIPARIVALPRLPMEQNGKRAVATFRQLARDHLRRADRIPLRGSLEDTIARAFEEVLGRQFSLEDDFFALGGHSLLATQARARLEGRLRRTIPLRLLFDAPTPVTLAAALRATNGEETGSRQVLLPRPDPATAEVGFGQSRLWFIERLGTGMPVYNVAHAVRLSGRLDLVALRAAVADLFARHAPLRTTFHDRNGEPVVTIRPPGEGPMEELGCFESIEAAVEALVHARSLRIDLARGPVARVLLLSLGDHDHLLGFVAHHIVCDGWSMLIATRDLGAFYAARRDPDGAGPAPLRFDYYDLVANERERERAGYYERGLRYWVERLRNAKPMLPLPYDKALQPRRTWRGEKIAFALSSRQSKLVREYVSRTGATPFMTLLTVYAALLHRLSQQDDIVIGTVSANRNCIEAEPLVGFLVNALAIRSRIDEGATFASHAAGMRQALIEANEYQDVPFELLVERLDVDRRSDYQAVFQVLFAMQTTPSEPLRLGDLVADRVRLPPTGAMFDLSLEMWDDANQFRGELEYSTDLFHDCTAGRIVQRFLKLIDELLARPQTRLWEAPLLPKEECDTLTYFSRGPALVTPPTDTPLSRVLSIAQRQPELVAFEGIGPTLTYGTFADRISAMAGEMARAGVSAGDRIGLLLPRGPLVAVGYFAAQWIGAVPFYLDPSLPTARLNLLARTVRLIGCLCTPNLAPPAGVRFSIICVDDAAPPGASVIPPRNEPRDAAYATFTSGTTAAPKVVQIAQAALAARLQANDLLFGEFALGTRFAHCYTFNYDGGLSSLFWPITRGATIVFLPLDVLGDGALLGKLLVTERVTVLDAIPAVLASLYDRWPSGGLPELALVITGGDVCPPRLAARHFERTRARFANQYGPCEAIINATTAVYDQPPERVTIGRPIAGVDILVLDRTGTRAPIGVHGEITIGGAYLADFYVDDPAATADRFPVLDPDGAGPRRWYKSGDQGRWLESGDLEFLGRIDRQVQIGGMRVELAEVESALSSFDGVESCHTFIDRRGALTACIVPGAGMSVSASEHGAKWVEVFDELYGGVGHANRNFTGWTETASGEDLPRIDMDAWLSAVLAIMRRRPFRRVLEIGSGLGLLALELAPQAERYLALDSSTAAVTYLAEEARRRGLDGLTVMRLDAASAAHADLGGPFDLIVINSVLQYLPDVHAVEVLLRSLMSQLAAEGRLFVGDVRDYRLREQFWDDVVRRRIGIDSLDEEGSRLTAEARMYDEELHLAPEFFLEVARSAGFRRSPSITLKQALLDNELANYRFDVIYDRVADVADDQEEIIFFSNAESFAGLSWRLRTKTGPVRIAGIPNRRLSAEGVDPTDVLALARQLECELVLMPCADPMAIDAVLSRPGNSTVPLPATRIAIDQIRSQGGNDPLLGMRARAYREAVTQHASNLLPAHMVPSRLRFVDRLPIKPGGKIDEEALQRLDPTQDKRQNLLIDVDLAFALMSDIWDELLGDGPFPREADFFALGGHSLMAARLAAAVRREFGVTLPIIRIFELRRLGAMVDEVARLSGLASEGALEGGIARLPACTETSLPSPTQAAILRSTTAQPAVPAHIGMAIKLRRPLKISDLERATLSAVGRHPLLTRRYDREGRTITRNAACTFVRHPFEEVDLSAAAAAALDLSRDGPFAMTAFGENGNTSHVVVRAHPFAFDSLSLQILLRDIAEALRRNDMPIAPDYASWAEHECAIASQQVSGAIAPETGVLPETGTRPGADRILVVERRWSRSEARSLGALAADLGVTSAAVLLGQLARLLRRETGLQLPVIACAASLRPFLPDDCRNDMIGPLTIEVPIAFDEPTDDVAQGALRAAGKMCDLFRTPSGAVFGRDPAAIAFSYRETAFPVQRLWPSAGGVRHAVSPLWNQIKLSVSCEEGGLAGRLSFRADALNEDGAKRLLAALVPHVEELHT
ncbi:condensation domain-containing protein [Mesorhizobium sp. M0618]|uniref:non-ribosomal peptide synthetase n=1 Tax=unclassified Mesorhizobium TaxID=325217 RepID=UPI003337E6A0